MVMCYIDYDNLPPACRSIRLDKGVAGGLDYLHKILTRTATLQLKKLSKLKLKASKDSSSAEVKVSHYNKQNVGLVGEGDLSYAEYMATAFGPHNHYITATTQEPIELLKNKYPGVEDRIKRLEKLGVKVVLNVDATKLKNTMLPYLINRGKEGDRWRWYEVELAFDVLVFMFPFAGHTMDGILPWAKVNQLMEGLFKAAPNVLVQNGQLHVTLNSSLAYKERKVEDLAKSAGFKLVDAKPFTLKECPMYRPRVCCGKYPNARLEMRSPLTMIFELEGDDDLDTVGDS